MKIIIALPLILFSSILFAQNNRQNDFNNINWLHLLVTQKISAKTEWLIEYQWRRTNGLKNWQQGLFKTAIQYKPSSAVSYAIGYAKVETFAYGDFPIASAGAFPEHRIFEQAVIKQNINKLSVTNRFRIEQRWLGKIKAGTNREIESWTFLNRFRYLLKIQYPLSKKLYAWLGDEVFIGAGRNMGLTIFDQNRIHGNLGYKLNKHVNFEMGYINQTLLQGRPINNKMIMQKNNGLVLTLGFNF